MCATELMNGWDTAVVQVEKQAKEVLEIVMFVLIHQE
jgi:hypothetical protein